MGDLEILSLPYLPLIIRNYFHQTLFCFLKMLCAGNVCKYLNFKLTHIHTCTHSHLDSVQKLFVW